GSAGRSSWVRSCGRVPASAGYDRTPGLGYRRHGRRRLASEITAERCYHGRPRTDCGENAILLSLSSRYLACTLETFAEKMADDRAVATTWRGRGAGFVAATGCSGAPGWSTPP